MLHSNSWSSEALLCLVWLIELVNSSFCCVLLWYNFTFCRPARLDGLNMKALAKSGRPVTWAWSGGCSLAWPGPGLMVMVAWPGPGRMVVAAWPGLVLVLW